MSSDDFEKRIQRQTIRPIPGEWRQEILEAAQNNLVEARQGFLPTIVSQLSTLLWPCPQAWAGLAAIWIVLFALNFATREPETVMAKSAPPSPEAIAAMKAQRKLYLELAGLNTKEAAEPPKKIILGPRSECRDEFQVV